MQLLPNNFAVTGHRPDKLSGYSDEATKRLVAFAKVVLIKYEPSSVTTGMALGWDTATAIASYRLGISFHAAIPFVGQESQWSDDWKKYYKFLLGKAADVVVVCEGEAAGWKYQRRNEYMVDRNEEVLALWDGSKGGTKNCVDYAVKQKKNVTNLWNDWNILCSEK